MITDLEFLAVDTATRKMWSSGTHRDVVVKTVARECECPEALVELIIVGILCNRESYAVA